MLDVTKRENPSQHGTLSLSVRPGRREQTLVKDDLLAFLNARAVPAARIDSYAMIVDELVTNSLKYGLFKDPEDIISVCVNVTGDTFSVSVTNPVDRRAGAYLEELDKVVQRISGFQDPFEAYLERIQENSRDAHDQETRVLGIARIGYEGRAALDFFLSGEDTLTVSASSKFVRL